MLKLAVLGRPFSSKSEHAQRLADKFGLKVLTPFSLVQSAVALAAREITTPADGGGDQAPAEMAGAAFQFVVELGGRASAALQEGSVVPDDVVAALVVAAIHEVDPVSYHGFVLDSYPETAAQAKLLEKGLTGYDPEQDKARPKGSKVAPCDDEPAPAAPPAGLDLVLRVDVSDDTARKRALGRRLDPQSGTLYHLEYDPPPDEPGLHERLVAVADAADAEVLRPALASYGDAEAPLAEWLGGLDVLLALDGESSFEGVALEAEKAVGELRERKQQREQERAAEAAKEAEAAEAEAAEGGAEAEKTDASEVPEGKADEEGAAAASAGPEAESEAPGEASGGTDGEGEEEKAAEPGEDGTSAEEGGDAQAAVLPPALTPEAAATVLQEWGHVEDGFVAACEAALVKLRDLKHRTLQRSAATRSEFVALLRTPDRRPEIVAAAQCRFNAMPTALRFEEEGKAELHATVEEMQQKIWAASDEKRVMAEQMLTGFAEDGWLAQHALRLVLAILQLSQAEAHRYVRTCTVLRLYTSLRAGGPIDLKLPELSPPKLPEAVELAVPPIDFGGRKEGVAEVKGRGKDGVFGTLSDSLASVIAAYSEPVAVPATQLTEESSDEERLVAEWTGTLATAVEGERCKLRRRQAALAHYGCGVLEELRSHAEKLQDELDKMLGDLVSKETAALSALATLMREAAEAGDELPHALTLDGEAVVVDESLLLLPPPPPPAPPPVEEATDSLRFNVSQLAALGGQLKKAASGHLIRATTLSALLEQLAAGSFDAAAPPLPAMWRPLPPSAFSRLASLFAAGEPPLVAWPALVASLAPVARPTAAVVSEALGHAARVLREDAAEKAAVEAAEAAEAAETEAEEEGDASEAEASIEAEAGEAGSLEEAAEGEAGEASAAPSRRALLLSRAQFDRVPLWFEDAQSEGAASLKGALWDLLSADGTIDLAVLLLYFCDRPEPAFAVLGSHQGGDAGGEIADEAASQAQLSPRVGQEDPTAASADWIALPKRYDAERAGSGNAESGAASGGERASVAMLSMDDLYAMLHRDDPPGRAELSAPEYADPLSKAALARLWEELSLCETERVPHALVARHPLGRSLLAACSAYTPKDSYALIASLHEQASNALKM